LVAGVAGKALVAAGMAASVVWAVEVWVVEVKC
jgi:hypothetical protein